MRPYQIAGLLILAVFLMVVLTEFQYSNVASYYPVEGFQGDGSQQPALQQQQLSPQPPVTPQQPAYQPYASQQSPVTPQQSTSSTGTSTVQNNYDNYNHYSQTAIPTTFYGNNGTSAVLNNNTITVNHGNGVTVYTEDEVDDVSNNSVTGPYIESFVASFAERTFYGPNGGNIVLSQNSGGAFTIVENTKNNKTHVFTTQGSPAQSQSFYSQSAPNMYPGYANTQSGGMSSTYSSYSSASPQGIPASAIPSGQEDLYILKSEIVPPVCPSCPTCPTVNNNTTNSVSKSFSLANASSSHSSSSSRGDGTKQSGSGDDSSDLTGNGSDSGAESSNSKCPPCPACARCPEPSFDCKKVPNYDAINSDQLPMPILNNFSTFGM